MIGLSYSPSVPLSEREEGELEDWTLLRSVRPSLAYAALAYTTQSRQMMDHLEDWTFVTGPPSRGVGGGCPRYPFFIVWGDLIKSLRKQRFSFVQQSFLSLHILTGGFVRDQDCHASVGIISSGAGEGGGEGTCGSQ